jgi:DNA (cytosine-5)-methyltransferase 1
MTHGSLFSGIGGFDLAAEWMGWENKFHCEWNPFGQKVLKHYWPDAELFTDITKSNFTKYAGTIDIISGGFPCQPYSAAGKRKGKEDERHLWPYMLDTIKSVRPRWVVGENVLGLVNWSNGLVFHEVQADLEAAGYEVWPYVLAAASVGAPHRRDRIWFVAYSKSAGAGQNIGGLRGMFNGCDQRKEDESLAAHAGLFGQAKSRKRTMGVEQLHESGDAADTDHTRVGIRMRTERNGEKENNGRDGQPFAKHRENGSNGDATDTNGIRQRRQSDGFGETKFNGQNCKRNDWSNFPTQSPICGRDDGIPDRLDGITFPKWRNESIKAYGNAVCPQVVHQIFKAIEQYEILNP